MVWPFKRRATDWPVRTDLVYWNIPTANFVWVQCIFNYGFGPLITKEQMLKNLAAAQAANVFYYKKIDQKDLRCELLVPPFEAFTLNKNWYLKKLT